MCRQCLLHERAFFHEAACGSQISGQRGILRCGLRGRIQQIFITRRRRCQTAENAFQTGTHYQCKRKIRIRGGIRLAQLHTLMGGVRCRDPDKLRAV